MFNVTRPVTQSPYQMIKHTNLLSLRTANLLATMSVYYYHLVLAVDIWGGEQYRVFDQIWARLTIPTQYKEREPLFIPSFLLAVPLPFASRTPRSYKL